MKKLRNVVCVTAVFGLTAVFAPSAIAGDPVDCTKYPKHPDCVVTPPPDNGSQSKCNAGRGNGSEGCDPGKSSTSPGGDAGQNMGGDEGGPIRGGTGAP